MGSVQEELEHQVQDVRTVFDGKFLSLTHRTDELHHNVLNRLGEIKAFMAKSKKVTSCFHVSIALGAECVNLGPNRCPRRDSQLSGRIRKDDAGYLHTD